jgi:ferric-dicitrate binding protein FerR (iron transport regulator)
MEKDYLIEKWLTNSLTEDELKAFELLEDHDLYIDIIENAKYFKASHFSEAAPFEKLEKQLATKTPIKKLNWIRPLMRIAAIFVVGVALYFVFFFNNLTQIQTLASEKTTIELPDASTVTLNALTEINFSENRWNRKREVELSGEAFFTVAKGAIFDVITSEGIVTVVGTQFNVKQRGAYFEVKCYQGIVRVSAGNITNELQAGETFQLNESVLTLGKTTYLNPQWTKDVSDFTSVPMREVIAELERQYNIKVTYDSAIEERLFTGGFVHGNLDNALKSITEPQGLTYTIESSTHVRLGQRGGQ